VRSLISRVSARPGGLVGAVISLAALGIALSVVVVVLATAFGHSSDDSGGHAAQTAADGHAAADDGQAADGGQAGGGMADMGGMHGEGSGGIELYAVQTGPLGVIVTDGAGRLLYGSAQDANDPPTSRCSGECAQQWLPLVVPPGQEPDLLGVDTDKVGRLTRDDGSSQLTLGGWPVYVNKNDNGELKAAPGAHGAWFVMTPEGGTKSV
jgi:predicted lipoprotein with Yx(FWY)xxD motif